MESRTLCWRGRSWLAMCERFSGSHFRCHGLGGPSSDLEAHHLDANTPSDLTVDGVRCTSLLIEVDKYACVELEVELSEPLPLIEFVPHKEFAPRAGDTSYQDALALARMEHSVDVAAIRETAAYWVFPVFQIGCCGVLVEKVTGKLVEFGSYTGLDNWIWGYEQGLLEQPPRDLIVVSVRDADATIKALKHFVARPSIERLPATFEGCAVWQAIRPLREAGDAFAWRCESHR
jgi:hypothetical protein